MKEHTTRKIYNVWSYFYDLIWPSIVHRRTTRAIERMCIQPGDRVLDIGVGTGLALASYPTHAKVVGIDLSEGMLRRARKRINEQGMSWVNLTLGNALEVAAYVDIPSRDFFRQSGTTNARERLRHRCQAHC